MSTFDILYFVTIFGKPDSTVTTVHGEVTFREWLESERTRIRTKSNWPVDIYTNPESREIALVYLRPTK
jgi:hypothetical protein